MKPIPVVDETEESASLTDLHDFGEFLADPSRIDAVVKGPAVINGEPVEEEACAVVLRSGVVVNVLGRNESAALFRAFRVGVAR